MAAIRLLREIYRLVLVCLVCAHGAAFAGLEEGLAADKRGDYETAFRELQPVAESGDATAQRMVGAMYFQGRGVRRNDQQALAWYRRAAEQGDAIAQFNLGLMHGAGSQGTPRDYQQAALWLRKAAEHGLADAQTAVGMAYVDGRGVPVDEQQAYFWFLLSSAQGDLLAKRELDLVSRKLNASQRIEAQTSARNWRPKSGDSSGRSPPAAPSAAMSPTRPHSANPDSTGSGFAIGRTSVVTNAHVVADCSRLSVSGISGIRVQAIDARNDLALLGVSALAPFASLRAGRLRQGDAITVVGYPLRGLLASGAQVTAGNVSALAGMQNDSRFIQISAPVQPGNSGGPLVDSSGNVVGVVVSKLNAVKMAQLTGDIPQNVNFAVSPLTLQGFLDANGVDYQTAPSNKNLSTADVADIAKKYTVLVECWK